MIYTKLAKKKNYINWISPWLVIETCSPGGTRPSPGAGEEVQTGTESRKDTE